MSIFISYDEVNNYIKPQGGPSIKRSNPEFTLGFNSFQKLKNAPIMLGDICF